MPPGGARASACLRGRSAQTKCRLTTARLSRGPSVKPSDFSESQNIGRNCERRKNSNGWSAGSSESTGVSEIFGFVQTVLISSRSRPTTGSADLTLQAFLLRKGTLPSGACRFPVPAPMRLAYVRTSQRRDTRQSTGSQGRHTFTLTSIPRLEEFLAVPPFSVIATHGLQ